VESLLGLPLRFIQDCRGSTSESVYRRRARYEGEDAKLICENKKRKFLADAGSRVNSEGVMSDEWKTKQISHLRDANFSH